MRVISGWLDVCGRRVFECNRLRTWTDSRSTVRLNVQGKWEGDVSIYFVAVLAGPVESLQVKSKNL